MTVALAFLVFGETLGSAQLAGGGLVLGAVVVLSARRAGAPAARARLTIRGRPAAQEGR